MKIFNNSKISNIAIVMMLSITVLVAYLPLTNAQYNLTMQTYTYLVALPPVVGEGQTFYITGWLDLTPPYTVTWGGDVYKGFTIEVTKPDGSHETIGPIDSDILGGYYTIYTPTQLGEYTFQSFFPGQIITVPDNNKPTGQWVTVIGDHTFLPSSSEPVTVTVQQDPIPGWVEASIPTDYWDRPISAVNREWYQISGNWLGGGHPAEDWNRYSKSPATAHIVWTKPYQEGGLVGGEYGSHSYHGGCAYEGKWYTPVVINGILYIQEYGSGGSQYYPDFVAVDLRTGEEVWRINATGRGDPVTQRLSGGGGRFAMWDGYLKMERGQILYMDTFNQHGAFAYLWASGGLGSTARTDMYDAFTGDYILSMVNVPRGTTVQGPNGEIFKYLLDTRNHEISLWNSSAAIGFAGPTGTDSAQWRPWVGATIDVGGPYIWNVSQDVNMDEPYTVVSQETIYDLYGRSYNQTNTLQNGLNGLIYSWWVDPISQTFSIPADISGSISAIDNNVIFGGTGPSGRYYTDPYTKWALSLEPGHEGELLWQKDYPAPSGNKTWQAGPISLEDGVYTIFEKETRQWYGFSTENGEMLWGPTESTPAFDMYELRNHVAYGKLISAGYGGEAYCIDLKTGNIDWTYKAADPYNEALYGGNYPLVCGPIADGKVILLVREHSPIDPKPRGAQLYCIDIFTGEELWTITHWSNVQHQPFALIADGYLVDADAYDMQIYCFGKGPTETTVTIQNDVIAKGESVLIRGTVSDQSPGAKQFVEDGRLSMVPAIADEDMTEWMEYLYKQFNCPENANGVTVSLDTIDPNGNFIHIGTVTSDMSGMFKKMWTPEIEGEYTVIATFEGSEAYFASYAETAIGVGPALAPSGPIEPEEPTTAAPLISTELAIILAVVVVAVIGVVAFWALRKRK